MLWAFLPAGGMPLGANLGSMGGPFGMPNPADLASNMQVGVPAMCLRAVHHLLIPSTQA